MKLRKKTRRPAVNRKEGAGNIHAKLTAHEVELIRQYFAIGLSVKLIASKFEISPQQVRNIVHNRSRAFG